MAIDTNELKQKALAEISKIEDKAVAEWLAIKTEQFSGKTLVISVLVAFVVGAILSRVV